jgi:hypothetical protein
MIRFRCPCGRQLQAAESNAGQPARCPLCDRVTTVPATDEPDRPPFPNRGVNEYGEIEREDHGDYQREQEPLRPERAEPRRSFERDEDYDDHRFGRRPYVTPTTCGDANTALWMGIVGLLCCQFLSPIALIYGIKAVNQINNSEGALTGNGQAIAGIVLGVLGSLILLINVVVVLMGG